MEKKNVYLEMPVDFETKRQWNAKGFKVVDAVFMPEGYENPAAETEAKDAEGLDTEDKPKRGK